MEQQIQISDDLASHINRFAADNDIGVDDAYELLIAVGFETIDGIAFDVYVEDDRLLFECPACGEAFEHPERALSHTCE
ncbi:hypothetical protein [Halorhabdus tiamatea]|uniref:hypothetical protein n=1 Tax=Halorhabdus tiamatea TaxID=430914 RepID=UPI0002122022|nr:hypothetical protein [Halorhabdus tiamatea]